MPSPTAHAAHSLGGSPAPCELANLIPLRPVSCQSVECPIRPSLFFALISFRPALASCPGCGLPRAALEPMAFPLTPEAARTSQARSNYDGLRGYLPASVLCLTDTTEAPICTFHPSSTLDQVGQCASRRIPWRDEHNFDRRTQYKSQPRAQVWQRYVSISPPTCPIHSEWCIPSSPRVT